MGAGNWDWWFSELVYSTWATTDQLEGTEQGFLFDADTLEPNIGPGIEQGVNVWKDLWDHAAGACDASFETGRCAVGYAPPGCWKSVFLNGVARKVNETVVWRPQMKSGKEASSRAIAARFALRRNHRSSSLYSGVPPLQANTLSPIS